MANNLLRLSLQVWNSGMGLGGVATTFYGILIFRAAGAQSSSSHHITIPWFFHAFLFVGIVLCAVSCLGHFAAKTANTCCLSTYVGIILVLLTLEFVMMTDAFFNPKWIKDLLVPVNQSGKLDEYVLKYLAFMVFLLQAICVLLAALSIHDNITDEEVDGYESEYQDQDEQPLLYSVARWQHSERYIV
ncbi:tetraspanin-19-like [Salvia miltiorrhiza]|uniref:tetraspanin-19-like n=1 Tax=Salvia miltiorrhiza TaxID=226208 RepID=UPI0025ABDF94|nr:tetraspanin-19-like [Salvia miltiorrhiza]